ncbi:MAG: hypothetical protein AAF412_00950 [Pseudomonadota bacterium]
MNNPVAIFIGIAAAIIAVAIFASFAFRKTIKSDKNRKKAKEEKADGDAIATWIGIEEADNH